MVLVCGSVMVMIRCWVSRTKATALPVEDVIPLAVIVRVLLFVSLMLCTPNVRLSMTCRPSGMVNVNWSGLKLVTFEKSSKLIVPGKGPNTDSPVALAAVNVALGGVVPIGMNVRSTDSGGKSWEHWVLGVGVGAN